MKIKPVVTLMLLGLTTYSSSSFADPCTRRGAPDWACDLAAGTARRDAARAERHAARDKLWAMMREQEQRINDCNFTRQYMRNQNRIATGAGGVSVSVAGIPVTPGSGSSSPRVAPYTQAQIDGVCPEQPVPPSVDVATDDNTLCRTGLERNQLNDAEIKRVCDEVAPETETNPTNPGTTEPTNPARTNAKSRFEEEPPTGGQTTGTTNNEGEVGDPTTAPARETPNVSMDASGRLRIRGSVNVNGVPVTIEASSIGDYLTELTNLQREAERIGHRFFSRTIQEITDALVNEIEEVYIAALRAGIRYRTETSNEMLQREFRYHTWRELEPIFDGLDSQTQNDVCNERVPFIFEARGVRIDNSLRVEIRRYCDAVTRSSTLRRNGQAYDAVNCVNRMEGTNISRRAMRTLLIFEQCAKNYKINYRINPTAVEWEAN